MRNRKRKSIRDLGDLVNVAFFKARSRFTDIDGKLSEGKVKVLGTSRRDGARTVLLQFNKRSGFFEVDRLNLEPVLRKQVVETFSQVEASI